MKSDSEIMKGWKQTFKTPWTRIWEKGRNHLTARFGNSPILNDYELDVYGEDLQEILEENMEQVKRLIK